MVRMGKPKSKFNLRMTTPDDMHLETYDHTKLSAVNTCPTWGILRYQMHKRMPGDGRAMALEAGSAMHECFSFIRLVTLMNQFDDRPTFQNTLWQHHGGRLFGGERLAQISEEIKDASDIVDVAKRGSIAVLDTSGFYDDPRDKRRTLSNLEECIYAYVNRWRWEQHVWMRDPDDATSDIGIEIPFDVVVEIEGETKHVFRLTGRIDGIHHNASGELMIVDNKTASRLNDAWAQSFLLSHQITGYCVAASVFTGHLVHKAEVIGLAIPLPKTYDFGGYMRETVNRRDYHYVQWAKWLEHTVGLTQEYANNPIDAPKFTHSCNRYFRPCSFIAFCDNNEEEQHVILSEMQDDEWSPLSKPVLDGVGIE
jgi:hypothetical protein